jgi:hypothetical protein
MEVTRQHVLDVLRRAGFADAAAELSQVLPDTVDLDRIQTFLTPYGINRDVLTSQMGGSP